ncbi:hypothetical protein WJX73_005563 [Symbiochloris irregularis]|uniref:HECT-type E3 ubiquitin transferase n=1 Tax=Symbiochloris irregularis TaxID=706552 RepID=A0AAW1NUJ4_9CHLO
MQPPAGTLKFPLRVKFADEDGVDEGGIAKELFQLLMRQLFDPGYGMFVMHETTRLYWFRSSSMDFRMEFELVGTLLALAIYNGHTLELPFPLVIYRKLLGKEATFADLQDVHPEIHDSLAKLFDMGRDEVASLQLTFQVEQEGEFGAANHLIDLVPDGGNCPVTSYNAREYADKYAQHLLSTSIAPQFNAFREGFRKLCAGPGIARFRPEELEQLVCGSRDLDFVELESACHYEDGFTSTSEVIRWFWEVAHSLPETAKRKLLGFITGSDRVPVDGLRNLKPPFTISRNGDHSERLPTAHTCFNHLLLPAYRNKEAVQKRLELAINNAEGFGLR